MYYVPVGLSLLSTFLSATAALGMPAEVYNHNTLGIWSAPSYLIVSSALAHIYIPVHYKLKINSVYEVRNVLSGGWGNRRGEDN